MISLHCASVMVLFFTALQRFQQNLIVAFKFTCILIFDGLIWNLWQRRNCALISFSPFSCLIFICNAFHTQMVEHERVLRGSTSRTMAAISLGFIVIVTPYTIQEVVAACTGSKVIKVFAYVFLLLLSAEFDERKREKLCIKAVIANFRMHCFSRATLALHGP